MEFALQLIVSMFWVLYGVWYIITRRIPMNGGNNTNYSMYPITNGVVQSDVSLYYADVLCCKKRSLVCLSRRVVKFKDSNGNMVLGIDDRVKANVDMFNGPKVGENEMFYYWECEGIKTIEIDGCTSQYTIHFCDEKYYEINTMLRLILNIGNIGLGVIAILAGFFILMQ